MTNRTFVMACLTPLFIFSLAFLALPLIRLFLVSGESDAGWAIYLDIVRKPRYLNTLVLTVLVSLATTFAALAVSTTAGMFLVRNRFRGRGSFAGCADLATRLPRRSYRISHHPFGRSPRAGKPTDTRTRCFCLLRNWLVFGISILLDPACPVDGHGRRRKA